MHSLRNEYFQKLKCLKRNCSTYLSKKLLVNNGYDYSLFKEHLHDKLPSNLFFVIACQSTLFSEEIQSLYTNVFMDITAYQRIFWLCQLNLVKLWANSFYQCVGISFWTTWRVILPSRRIVSNDQTYPLKTTTLLRNYSRWVYEQSSSKN